MLLYISEAAGKRLARRVALAKDRRHAALNMMSGGGVFFGKNEKGERGIGKMYIPKNYTTLLIIEGRDIYIYK